MTKLGLLGGAVALSSALASPVMAQQVISNPGYCAQFYPNANCQNTGPGNPSSGDYGRPVAYRASRALDSNASWNDDRWDRRTDSGISPGDVAAGVVGGAIGTASAIATAPFRGDAYAYYNNGDRTWYQSYAARNGFVCQPGTWVKGEDGRQHICQ